MARIISAALAILMPINLAGCSALPSGIVIAAANTNTEYVISATPPSNIKESDLEDAFISSFKKQKRPFFSCKEIGRDKVENKNRYRFSCGLITSQMIIVQGEMKLHLYMDNTSGKHSGVSLLIIDALKELGFAEINAP